MNQTRRRTPILSGGILTAALIFVIAWTFPAQGADCEGDCNGDSRVAINELVMMVDIALGKASMSACSTADTNRDGRIFIDELVKATNDALHGCQPGSPSPTPTPGGGTCDAAPFNSTFEAIQKVIFDKRGCTQALCHGSSPGQGELNLLPDVAYQNIVGAKSSQTELNRVEIGDKDRSYLWLKAAAATNPTALPPGFQISGAPMPNGLSPLTADELEALRLWIYAGAPKDGTVAGTDKLLDACLPTPEPLSIQPLDPPAPDAGLQFSMPPWHLEAHSEHELCFATYYDLTQQVPAEFQDPTGTLFRFSGIDLRQDPQSHHLILNRYCGDASQIHDPTYGKWTCTGGDKAGQACEPTDLSSCGSGTCTSEIKQDFACVGFGPNPPAGSCNIGGSFSLGNFYAIGGAQQAQLHTQFVDGVFASIPMKGVLYWNSHAFNLTDQDTTMHAWLNYYYAVNQQYPVQTIFDIRRIFDESAAPYTTETLCNDHVLPQGAQLFNLTSHTHKHGKHFTVSAPAGSVPTDKCTRVDPVTNSGCLLYENFVYNDPANITFDPPLVFDSPDPAQRTLHYCSLFNNGVKADGSPDTDLVTHASLVPPQGFQCVPVACIGGKPGAPCSGKGDDRTCDSAAGANDGTCDACPLTGGESTQNEMFILIGSYYLPATGAAGESAALDAFGRSTSTEVALPPQVGCSSSHAGHAGHAMQ